MAYDPKDPADKKIFDDAIKAALEEAAEQHEADVAGLKAKNTELRQKLSKAKAGEGDDAQAEVDRLETELATVKKDLSTAQKDLKATTKQLGELTTERDGLSTSLTSTLVDGGLTSELAGAKVDAKFLPAVKALLSPKVTIKTEADGTRKAVVGDKSLGDYIKEWSQGDEGKTYISAAGNNGGGAGGSQGGTGGGKTMSRSAYEQMQPAEAAAFFSSGGTLTD
jgi:uncharacterized protein YoxC